MKFSIISQNIQQWWKQMKNKKIIEWIESKLIYKTPKIYKNPLEQKNMIKKKLHIRDNIEQNKNNQNKVFKIKCINASKCCS